MDQTKQEPKKLDAVSFKKIKDITIKLTQNKIRLADLEVAKLDVIGVLDQINNEIDRFQAKFRKKHGDNARFDLNTGNIYYVMPPKGDLDRDDKKDIDRS